MRKTCFLLTCLSILLLSAVISNAQEQPAGPAAVSGQDLPDADTQPSVEDLLEGFDEGPTGNEDSLDTVLDGFEEATDRPTKTQTAPQEPSRLSLDGHVLFTAAATISHNAPQDGRTDWRGLSRLSPELFLEADYAFSDRWKAVAAANFFYDAAYGLNGRKHYTDGVINDYETEAEIRDLYLSGRLSEHLDLKAGRQIVVWGKSDTIRVTDVINPLDMRRPGMTDIEDLRLPVAMTRLDYYRGAWNLTGLALHEHRFNKNPPYGSDFFAGSAPLPNEEIPDHRWENTQWALALNGIFSGKDISLYWANIYNDQPHAERDRDNPPPAVHLVHERIAMAGAAYNQAMGNWLLKTEAAWFDGLRFAATGSQTFSRLDVLAGAEYSGFSETTISLELVNRHIVHFDRRLAAAPDHALEDEFQSALRISRDFANDTVTVTLLASTFGPLGQEGAFQRLTVDYDIMDALTLTCGVIAYQSGDRYTMERIGDNDRLFAEIKYSF